MVTTILVLVILAVAPYVVLIVDGARMSDADAYRELERQKRLGDEIEQKRELKRQQKRGLR